MGNDYKTVFHAAMGIDHHPYPYQMMIAEGTWPESVNVPTGMGKTAAIILAWIYKRLRGDKDTPRRLVYCLPMRVLVEQTVRNAREWTDRLVASGVITTENRPAVCLLMGGEIDRDWDRYPEQDAILVGTQDHLISASLNRGYASSRFRWPIQFGLLNNDCLWVMDEIQLMGSGLATTTQMQAFRQMLGCTQPVKSVWMSATMQKDWLDTIDFNPFMKSLRGIELSNEDMASPSVHKRFSARKRLEKASCRARDIKNVSELIAGEHKKGTRTLVVVNNVKSAQDLYLFLVGMKPKAFLTLVHSRFRPPDRQVALGRLLEEPGPEGTIAITTQVVEAGVDVSARTLITELAPWPSLVQRFGRCNRYGLDSRAKVLWLDIDEEKKGSALPYQEEEMGQARAVLESIRDAGPESLPDVKMPIKRGHVIRRRDILELADTTPDLSGMDIDISRFVRDSDDADVQLFWRDIPSDGPSDEPDPARSEICTVPVGVLRSMKGLNAWRWDHIDKVWVKPQQIYPGMILMMPRSAGCYRSDVGWTGTRQDVPELTRVEPIYGEGNDDDPAVFLRWQSLVEHNENVTKELKAILERMSLNDEEWVEILLLAARWHDAGKTHPQFQVAIRGDSTEVDPSVVWAKSALKGSRYERPGFRHELASALSMLQHGHSDLAVYLVAAHHGKIRFSIRSLPHETGPDDPDRRFARGVWDGDILRSTDLGGGCEMPETVLDLSCMEFGEGPRGQSWLSRMLNLRDDPNLGPFRLAYLEALLRAADWRASQA
jgi:CRISPR-associated endonuclease/helicase Cas3